MTKYLGETAQTVLQEPQLGTGHAAMQAESLLKGKTRSEAEQLFEIFHSLVRGELDPRDRLEELGKLAAFSGVSEFPARVKCASLPWHSMHGALGSDVETVSTES